MPNRATAYALLVALVALISAILLHRYVPTPDEASLNALLILSGLAVIAEVLGFVLPNRARGSIAFIPYLAIVAISPSWHAVVAVTTVKAVMEGAQKISAPAALLNTASHALTTTLAIAVYLGLGGVGMLALSAESLLGMSSRVGIAALFAFSSSFFANALIVCVFISLQKRKPLSTLWRQLIVPTIALDLIASPLVFVFAWVYAAHGAIAALALWVPILGLREVHRVNLELQRTNQELLELMVKSIEARDPYTSGHSRRVQHYSSTIARGLGLSEKQIEHVSRAALLHDVGKIYEKYAPILRKDDKLDPSEWVTMKEHPEDGANLVATMSGLHDLVPAVRHHHENWDGSGYPKALVGEEIPLASRIIAFADTIDAMTSERPYRAPLSSDVVREEIRRCRGAQFDPRITDVVLAEKTWSQLFSSTQRVITSPVLSVVRSHKPKASATA
jgi:putative nucleotidyltransferase with HDIG domain